MPKPRSKKPKTPLTWSLKFKDKSMEEFYCVENRCYQLVVSLFIKIYLTLFSILFWALDRDPFKLELIILNALKILLITIYIWARKKYPKSIELTLIIIVGSFCIISIESFRLSSEVSGCDLNSFFYGFFCEVYCVIWLLLRVSWRRSAIMILAINFLIFFRLFEYKAEPENKRRPIQMGVASFLFHSICAFIIEKKERMNYFDKKQKEKSLVFLENFIQGSLPLGVIVINKNKILFTNQESKRLLGLEGKPLTFEDLNTLELEVNDALELNSDKSIEHQKSQYNKGSLKAFLDSFKNQGRRGSNMFVGKKIDDSHKTKNNQKLIVKVSKVIWKEEFATIVTLAEDISVVKLEYLKDFEIFKDRVLASVSHQFRTPLNAIMGVIENVKEITSDSNIKECLDIAMTSSQRLLSIINDILDFSQINLGKFSLNIKAFSIDDLMEDLKLIFGSEARLKGVELLVMNESKDTNQLTREKTFYNDEGRLKQILCNFLSNSLRFTTIGFIKVTYELFLTPQSREEVMTLKISIEDTGCGIKEDMLTKLFEFFGKIQERDYKGLNTDGIGFGLAISQRLLSVMNNDYQANQIKASSILGRGSVFSFELNSFTPSHRNPASQSNHELFAIEEMMFDDKPIETINNYNFSNGKSMRVDTTSEFIPKIKRKKKILIVDDDKINIIVIVRFLDQHPEIDHQTTFNGQEALLIIEEEANRGEPFDLVLMDCNMPIMDGYEATSKIREMINKNALPDTPIIAITANALLSDLEKCLECGMTDYLTKPFTKAQLISKIQKYL